MDANGHRRVMITGLDAVTPLANDVQSSWEQLIAGRGAAGPITAFDTTGFAVMFACEATDFEPMQWIERKQARRMDRCAQLIVAEAQQARADAGLEIEPECDRVGVSVATAMGGLKSFEDACETLLEGKGKGRDRRGARPPVAPRDDDPHWVRPLPGAHGETDSHRDVGAGERVSAVAPMRLTTRGLRSRGIARHEAGHLRLHQRAPSAALH